MAKAFIDDTNLTNIASAIRTKLGVADTYLPSEMAGAILSIPKRKVVDFNVTPITLNGAKANSLQYVKAYGKCEQNGTPTPTTPVDIVCNNGVLKARHESGLPLGYTLLDYIESSGTQYIDTGYKPNTNTTIKAKFVASSYPASPFGVRWTPSPTYDTYGFIIESGGLGSFYYGRYSDQEYTGNLLFTTGMVYDIEINDTTAVLGTNVYNISRTAFTSTYSLTLCAFNNQDSILNLLIGRLYAFEIKESGVLVHNFIPCKNASSVVGMYDLISGQFLTNQGTGDFVAGNTVSDPIEIYTLGNQETLQLGSDIATCERLLSLNGYTDTQEILSGVVNRKIGVKVLNGTESWVLPSGNNNVYYISNISNNAFGDGVPSCYSTHFIGEITTVNGQNQRDESIKVGYSAFDYTAHRLYLKSNNFNGDTEVLKSWLQTQYANGTPVIIIYPLATPTTESVTGQTLQVQAGDNTLEITQSALSGLEVECEYFLQ